ncbi:MAG: hypothetical protein ACOWWO_18930, partial [Peptococcaceae bacterium]
IGEIDAVTKLNDGLITKILTVCCIFTILPLCQHTRSFATLSMTIYALPSLEKRECEGDLLLIAPSI